MFSQTNIEVPYELLLKLAEASIILVATWVVSKILGRFLLKAIGKISLKAAQQVRRIVTWLIWFIGILICLDQLGLELNVLLIILALGVLIWVIAFRDVLLNLASHQVITAYNMYKVGDWIQVGRVFGRVVDITWIDTVLVTPNNEMIYIPNSKIVKSTVTNKTASGEIRISVSLTVNEAVKISEIEKILLEIADELKKELTPDSKPEVRVLNVNNHAIKLALLLKINNPAKSAFIASEVRKRAQMKINELREKH